MALIGSALSLGNGCKKHIYNLMRDFMFQITSFIETTAFRP